MEKLVIENRKFVVNQVIVKNILVHFNPGCLCILCIKQKKEHTKALVIQEQGSFAIGGNVSTNPGQDFWRVRLEMAKRWRNAVNQHGGEVTVLHLPEIADLMSRFLKEKGLD